MSTPTGVGLDCGTRASGDQGLQLADARRDRHVGLRPYLLRHVPALIRSLVEEPLRRPALPLRLAWVEIVQSYRRSFLGPFWITLNLVIFTIAMTFVYGALFSMPTAEYAAFLACGMIVWSWVSALLTEAGNTFINNGHFVKNTCMDKSVLIWTFVYRQVIILAHHLIVYVALIFLGVIKLSLYTALALPAFGVLFLLSVPITAIMSILFPRFRDLARLIASLILVILLITPIFWQATMMTGWRTLVYLANPVYYIVEFARAPLLGKPPDPIVVAVVLAMTAAIWVLGAAVYRRYAKYVVFWL
jgi:ABC-type polysaccharide/polyol phosphate export permease